MDPQLIEALRGILAVRNAPEGVAPASHAGVLYAEDFDAPPRPQAPPAAPPPPPERFTAEQVAAARDAGYANGLAAARESEAIQAEALRLSALQAVADGLAGTRERAAAVAGAAAEQVARTVFALLSAALPATCARCGEDEMRALARAVLPSLAAEPQVVVRACPRSLEMLQDDVGRLDPDLASLLVLQPNPALPPGDVRITWRDGSAARDTRTIIAAVRDVLAPLGLLELPRPAAPGLSSSSASPASGPAVASTIKTNLEMANGL